MFTARERIYSPPQHRQSLPLSHNPDSRVSKVFNVLCLNTRRFGLRQHRLYGRAPLHGLNSTVQLYAHKEVCRHALAAMIRVGNCIRFSTSRFHPEPVSIKDTHLLKERRKAIKMSMSSISAYKSSLRIYCITEPSKSCGTYFSYLEHIAKLFYISLDKITFFPALRVLGHITHFCCEFVKVFFQCGKHLPFAVLRFTGTIALFLRHIVVISISPVRAAVMPSDIMLTTSGIPLTNANVDSAQDNL